MYHIYPYIYPYLNDIQFRILFPSILEVPVFQWISNGSPLGLSKVTYLSHARRRDLENRRPFGFPMDFPCIF